MGWFGSLGLAYKYVIVFGSLLFFTIVAGASKIVYDRRRLKKFIKQAELEAAGAQEERVELNARELDEGDLFGIRAIQSGYFGGVAQSRPVSVAGSQSPDGSVSVSNTLLGSRPSPKSVATTPLSSVSALPLDSKQPPPSPLAHNVISMSERDQTDYPSDRNPLPGNSRLRPSNAELSGRINHDPSVNTSLDIPPSPISQTRPPATPPNNGYRSPSPSYPFPRAKINDSSALPMLRPGTPHEIQGSAQLFSTPEHPSHEIKSQSGSIVSRSTSANSNSGEKQALNQGQLPSSHQDYTEFPTRPSRAVQIARHLSNGSQHPPRSSSIQRRSSEISNHEVLDNKDRITKNQLVEPAVHDWRSSMFHEFNHPVEYSRSRSIHDLSETQSYPGHSLDPSTHHDYSNQPSGSSNQPFSHQSRDPSQQNHSNHVRDLTYDLGHPQLSPDSSSAPDYPISRDPSSSHGFTHHTSKLSDASSIYSMANPNHRISRKISLDSKTLSQATSTLPSSAPSETDDHQHPTAVLEGTRRISDASSHQPVSGSESNGGSSHRNTRELGDFYDSYWRQSTLGPGSTNARGESGKQAYGNFSTPRGAGELGKDNKRPGQMDLKVTTIVEVPTPLSSPMPGTAL